MLHTTPQWGICTTVKAPLEQVQAFAAYHLNLGAAHIWLHFDDPDDPAANHFTHPQITTTLCSHAYWMGLIGKRPERHQNRQGRNMQRVYQTEALPWIAHIDVDEYILPNTDIPTALAALPPDQSMLRMAPYEALHDPSLPDDIFTATQFRAALNGQRNEAARSRAFGPYAPLLTSGVLSHSAGKCFFRTGLSRFEPRLHGAFRAGTRVPGGEFHPNIALLHFHAQDPARWRDRLHFRLTRGAYQYNPALQDWLIAASDTEIDAFYVGTQTATPDTLHKLRAENALLTATLNLRQTIADMGLQ
ncbi:glycosyltransferase family 2 protein [Pseudorhodobacter ferrugineus]|uniref:glycosyltransferase family 2 protein n=1 Tax=Pseudorhodobacter ferrugineus TaxID=77008 RepID=UPI0003B3547D|nr:glycosyltransferase family 2 protein [Pseudorhodobacter ferrugineus]